LCHIAGANSGDEAGARYSFAELIFRCGWGQPLMNLTKPFFEAQRVTLQGLARTSGSPTFTGE
jgi:hypothetical protein